MTLSAMHVYRALSSSTASLISNEPSSWTVYLPSPWTCSPSFVHVTVGVGTPLVGHWMVMFVLVGAVTSSPMLNEMGLRSWASMIVGLSGTLITGLEGSIKWNYCLQSNNQCLDVSNIYVESNWTRTQWHGFLVISSFSFLSLDFFGYHNRDILLRQKTS